MCHRCAGFSVAREAFKGGFGKERIDLNAKTWSISRTSRFSRSEASPLVFHSFWNTHLGDMRSR